MKNSMKVLFFISVFFLSIFFINVIQSTMSGVWVKQNSSNEPTKDPISQNFIKPDRINVTFYNSTASSRAFTWYTQKKSASIVQLVSNNPTDFSNSKNYSGVTSSVNIKGSVYYVHKVIVNGLTKETRYYYRLGDESKMIRSEVGTFTTSSNSQNPFSFIHITDSQGGYPQTANVLKHAFSLYPQPAFIAHTGDIVDRTDWDEKEWSDFFNLNQAYLLKTTIAPASGNHDYNKTDKSPNMFHSHFTLKIPNNSNVEKGAYYSFDYENAHFTVINTNDFSTIQEKWLIEDLASVENKWKIVLLHRGIYSNGNHANSSKTLYLRKILAPIFDTYTVDLVLQGHDHTYLRTKKIHAKKPVSSKSKGVVYITARSSGIKFYDIKKVEGVYPARTIAGETPIFSSVTIKNNSLTYNAYEVYKKQKTLIDSVTLEKNN